MDLRKYAIVDLHLHLDGALSPEIIIKRAFKEGIDLPEYTVEGLKPYLVVPKHCESLNEYLTKFDIPNLVLQTKEGLFECTLDLLHRLANQGLKYIEIRMAPQLSTNKGLSQKEVVESVLEAIKRGESLYEIRANLILCLMRGNTNRTKNLETLLVAKEFKNKGVVAVDLAGAEAVFPNEMFKEEFETAKQYGLNVTIHAGEALGADSVKSALMMGANRIGHGVHSLEDKSVVDELVERKIPLELCPTSNLDTKAIYSLKEFPVKEFLDLGVIVTINTDDPTVSDTTLLDEYKILEVIGLNENEIRTIAFHSIESAFLNREDKELIKSFIIK